VTNTADFSRTTGQGHHTPLISHTWSDSFITESFTPLVSTSGGAGLVSTIGWLERLCVACGHQDTGEVEQARARTRTQTPVTESGYMDRLSWRSPPQWLSFASGQSASTATLFWRSEGNDHGWPILFLTLPCILSYPTVSYFRLPSAFCDSTAARSTIPCLQSLDHLQLQVRPPVVEHRNKQPRNKAALDISILPRLSLEPALPWPTPQPHLHSTLSHVLCHPSRATVTEGTSNLTWSQVTDKGWTVSRRQPT